MRDSYNRSSCLAVFTNTWQRPFICKAYKNNRVHEEDLFAMGPQDHTELLTAALSSSWNQEALKPEPSLLRAVARVFSRRYLCYSLVGVGSA